MAAFPNCPVCKDETRNELHVWLTYRESASGPRQVAMKPYAPLALLGILLLAPQPLLRAADSRAEKERAIAAIQKLGGVVDVDSKNPDKPVVGVNLKYTKVDDASLEHLKGLGTLEVLRLQGTTVTDDGLVYLKGLTNIEALELSRTKVTDRGLKHLTGFSKLQHLDLGGTEVTDKGLEHLKKLINLETINLSEATGVSDAGLVHLKALTKLSKLNLAGTKVTEAGIQELRKVLPKATITR